MRPFLFLTLHYISIMFLEYLLLHQILHQFIKFVMIISVGVILMKTLFPFRLWPRGKSFTKARVKMEFTLSILKRLHNSLYHPKFVTVLLVFLFLIKLFGIWGLIIHLIKVSSICFLMPMLVSISVPLLILLVHTVCMVKCTICLFLNLILLPQFHLSLYILIYGVLLHLIPLMALNTMFCSLITLPGLLGFICLSLNLKFLLSLFGSKPWLKISFQLKLRSLDQMVGWIHFLWVQILPIAARYYSPCFMSIYSSTEWPCWKKTQAHHWNHYHSSFTSHNDIFLLVLCSSHCCHID